MKEIMKASLADRLSQYPVTQQVVGMLTVGSNVVKLGLDLVKTINNLAVTLLATVVEWRSYSTAVNNQLAQGREPEKEADWDQDEDLLPKPRPRHLHTDKLEDDSVCYRQAIKAGKLFKESYCKETEYGRHLQFIVIGLIRATPLIGSGVSYLRCKIPVNWE